MNKYYIYIWQHLFGLVYGPLGYKAKIVGVENMPKEGSLIVAPNHLSNNDPPLMGYALPRVPHFMAKVELFNPPLVGMFLKTLGAFPVHRGKVDKIAIRRAMEILQRGDVLGIFPEGNRQEPGKLGAFHDGVASLALRTGTPILPVGIVGTKVPKRGQVRVTIGKPIYVEKAKPTVDEVARVNEELRKRLEELTKDE